MLDIGFPELVVILVIAVLVFGPERLPRMISQGAQWLRVIKAQATAARDDLMNAADLDPQTAGELHRSMSELAELHPRRLATSLLQDVTGPVTAAVNAGKDAAGLPASTRGSISPVVPPPAAPVPPMTDVPLPATPALPPAGQGPTAATGPVVTYDDDIT